MVAAVIRPQALTDYIQFDTYKQNEPVLPKSKSASGKVPDEKHLATMFLKVKEFATIKRVMERNCEYIRFDHSQRVKTVDCKVMHVAVADLLRHKTVMKIEDENYIFIRRAIGVRQLRDQQRRRPPAESSGAVGSAQSDNHFLPSAGDSGGDENMNREQRKRQRVLFKKLLFLNTRRMLEILGYKTGETETKKLMHAMRLDRLNSPNSGAYPSVMKNGLGMGEVEDLEDKVLEMG